MIKIQKLFHVEHSGRDLGKFTASELRELSEIIDRSLYPLGYREAVIFDEVCLQFGISRVAIHTKGRKEIFTFPRQVVIYLMRQRGYERSKLAEFFEQEEATIDHAVRSMHNRIETEPKTKHLMTELGKSIDSKLGENGHDAALNQTRQYHYKKKLAAGKG